MTRKKKILIVVLTLAGLYILLAVSDTISLASHSGKKLEVKIAPAGK